MIVGAQNEKTNCVNCPSGHISIEINVLNYPQNHSCVCFLILAIPCEDPPKVVGAMMVGDGFVFQEQVHYTCRDGYRMEGSRSLICGANGKWIGQTPVCKGPFRVGFS